MYACLYTYTHIHMYIYVYAYIYIPIHIYIYIYTYTYIHIHTYTHTHEYIHVQICIRYVYTNMYTCMHARRRRTTTHCNTLQCTAPFIWWIQACMHACMRRTHVPEPFDDTRRTKECDPATPPDERRLAKAGAALVPSLRLLRNCPDPSGLCPACLSMCVCVRESRWASESVSEFVSVCVCVCVC